MQPARHALSVAVALAAAAVFLPGAASGAVAIGANAANFTIDSDAGDSIAVSCNGLAKVQVLANGVDQNVQQACSAIGKLTITAVGNFANDINVIGISPADYTSLTDLTIKGGGANDTIVGSFFGDQINGESGSDTVTGGGNADTLSGGDGDQDRLLETASFAASVTLTDASLTGLSGTDTISGFELATLNGSSGADTLDASGFSGAATLIGGDGADGLNGGSGPDTLVGGPMGDSLVGGNGADSFSGGAGEDTLNAVDVFADAAIDCGDDTDTGQTDTLDPTPIGCETVNGAPPGGGGPPGGGNPGGGTMPDTQAPVMEASARRATRRGRLPLRLRCPATETSCSGSFVLRLAGSRTVLGRGTFRAQGGTATLVNVKLTRRALALLRLTARLTATLKLTVSDAAGNRATQRTSVSVRRARRR
jgi:hypothetical protein